ncbi:hypothetical protein P4O66_011807, partial [Electrophorus voltai]
MVACAKPTRNMGRQPHLTVSPQQGNIPPGDIHREPQRRQAGHRPQEYEDLAQAFSTTRATLLPSHREGDCGITIKEGASSGTLVLSQNPSQTNSEDQLSGSGGPPKVEESFEVLKATFTTVPVLQQPDPKKPFIVEVDALDTGVGIVLSQHTVEHWCRESEKTWEETHQRLRKAISAFKRKADRQRGETLRYSPGQEVWVSTRDGHVGAPGKLAASQASRAFHVLALKPVTRGPLAVEEVPLASPPPPLETVESLVYKVRTLLDSRRRGGGLHYLMDWEGYGPEECSWVPASQILDPDLIASFHQLHLRRSTLREQ